MFFFLLCSFLGGWSVKKGRGGSNTFWHWASKHGWTSKFAGVAVLDTWSGGVSSLDFLGAGCLGAGCLGASCGAILGVFGLQSESRFKIARRVSLRQDDNGRHDGSGSHSSACTYIHGFVGSIGVILVSTVAIVLL